MKTYVQLTYEQRCQIYALNNTDLSLQKIANAAGVSQSTISRELRRNRGKRGYHYQYAQGRADTRRQQAAKALKMTPNMIKLIELKLGEKWSPEQISGWLLEECSQLISHETIYRHVWNDKRSGGVLYTHLRR